MALVEFFKKVFGSKEQRDINEIKPIVDKINSIYLSLKKLSNDELRQKTVEFKKRIAKYISKETEKIKELKSKIESDEINDVEEREKIYNEIDKLEELINNKTEDILNEILPEAFAVVKETCRRFKENKTIELSATEFDKQLATKKSNVEIVGEKAIWHSTWKVRNQDIRWDMVHYDVQLMGGIVLHQGKIAEMQTGEGKTLVATLPLYLNALPGKGVHLVTVNDYLAQRDAEWMGPIFEFHGLSVDCIDKHQPGSAERRKAYLADITYGTNNEFGFDYLRDNMVRYPDEIVQRGHNYAIVDEVDSVLIDDARTPLIISGPIPQGDKHEFYQLKPKVEKLVQAQKRYVNTLVNDAKKLLKGISEGKKLDKKTEEKGGLALLRAYRGLPKNKALIKFLSEPGIKTFLQKTEAFYMQDQSKEMHKTVDPELYFVIDEKNNTIELTEKGIDLITESTEDKEFFIMPNIGEEIAKIENSDASEEEKNKLKNKLMRDYAVKAERIHTINQLLRAYTLFEKDVEYVIMDGKVKIVDEQTGRILEGRRYSDGLHQAIEAKENVKVEAATQTYATITLQNYFRMYNKLAGMTGTAETEAQEFWDIYKLDVVVIPTNLPVQRKDLQDKVYKTKREKYNAIIDEIENLISKKRPVLVGTTSVEVSELLSRMLKLRKIKHNVLNAKLHQREAEIVAEAGKAGTVTIATNMAGRGTDIKLGEGVKEAGGLAIIGTERHESRRVDRQLRGRAGRQGDPGTSQFFVSLEDNLMRLFGSERIAKIMDRLGYKEGEVIQHPMITKSIERAQKKVEENNFGIRKRLLEYDDVMNNQREVIYTRRRHALFGERLNVDIANMIYDLAESITNEHKNTNDFENFKYDLLRYFSMESPVNENEFQELNINKIIEKTYLQAIDIFAKKCEIIAQQVYPLINHIYETEKNKYKKVVIPFSNGIKTIGIPTDIEKAIKNKGKEFIKEFEKTVLLMVIDEEWKEHLRELDDLKQSVQNAVYEQKDPLLVYKLESFNLFKQMIDRINKESISFLFKGGIPIEQEQELAHREFPEQKRRSRLTESRTPVPEFTNASTEMRNAAMSANQEKYIKRQPVRVEKKVGRNEPCPCGSGKKYKHCHGR